jgi:hypothetical protein
MDDKSKESLPPVDNSPKSTGGSKEKHHEQEDGDVPGSSLLDAD